MMPQAKRELLSSGSTNDLHAEECLANLIVEVQSLSQKVDEILSQMTGKAKAYYTSDEFANETRQIKLHRAAMDCRGAYPGGTSRRDWAERSPLDPRARN